MPFEFIESKILFVEGIDEINTISALMKEREKWSVRYNSADDLEYEKDAHKYCVIHKSKEQAIQIVALGGKEKFNSDLPDIKKISGFKELINSIGIILDADSNYNATYESASNTLKSCGLPSSSNHSEFTNSNPRIGIFIIPAKDKVGMLESLCLESIAEYPIMQCVNNYIECAKIKGFTIADNKIDKSRCQIYLSTHKDLPNSVGRGAQKKCWNFNHSCFDELCEFIKSI